MSWFIAACETLFTWQNWPVIAISIGMILAGVIDWWIFKVPNKLTYPLIISGWLLGLWHSLNQWFGWDLRIDAGTGGIGSSLLGTFVAFLLLFFVYFVGGVGAGDVKMQMGFGSWIGAFFGVERTPSPQFLAEGDALSIIWWAFCAGVIAGGIIGLGMILVRRQFQQNLQHTRDILTDLVKAGPVEASKRAGERRSRWHKLPYGIPLCIGFVGYLFYLYSQQMQ